MEDPPQIIGPKFGKKPPVAFANGFVRFEILQFALGPLTKSSTSVESR